MYIQHNKRKLSSYTANCLNIFGSALVRHLIINNYEQVESFNGKITELDSTHVKNLKIFIETLANFEILEENPEFSQKIAEWNDVFIHSLDQKTYSDYVNLKTLSDSVLFVSEAAEFERLISVSLLRVVLASTIELNAELMKELSEKQFTKDQKRTLEQKSMSIQNVILKLKEDLKEIDKMSDDSSKIQKECL